METLFVKKLREAGFTQDQIDKIMEIKDSLCQHCLDHEVGDGKRCYCTYED